MEGTRAGLFSLSWAAVPSQVAKNYCSTQTATMSTRGRSADALARVHARRCVHAQLGTPAQLHLWLFGAARAHIWLRHDEECACVCRTSLPVSLGIE
eukprot:5785706-Pleurochrysis_carterae.AAC.1